MPALTFCKDSVEASVFTLRLAMDKLASDAGMAHLYDIDRREFVVVHALGPVPGDLLGLRTGDADPLAAEALRTRGAIIVPAPESDPRLVGRRWDVLRSVAGRPLVSIACVRAAQAGRFLGLIELVNLGDGSGGFAEGDDNALFYIAEKFTEFVAAHGVILSGDG
jgi:GAF domain-containing protein